MAITVKQLLLPVMERMTAGSDRYPPMIAVRADAATPSRDEQRAWINGRLKAILELEINPIASSVISKAKNSS